MSTPIFTSERTGFCAGADNIFPCSFCLWLLCFTHCLYRYFGKFGDMEGERLYPGEEKRKNPLRCALAARTAFVRQQDKFIRESGQPRTTPWTTIRPQYSNSCAEICGAGSGRQEQKARLQAGKSPARARAQRPAIGPQKRLARVPAARQGPARWGRWRSLKKNFTALEPARYE